MLKDYMSIEAWYYGCLNHPGFSKQIRETRMGLLNPRSLTCSLIAVEATPGKEPGKECRARLVLWMVLQNCRVWKCLTLAPRWASVSHTCRVWKFHEWAPHRVPLSQMCQIYMYLKWAPILYSILELPHSTNVSQDRGSWIFLPARAWDIILGSSRERARAKKSSSLHSVCLGSLNWNETGSDLLVSEDEL